MMFRPMRIWAVVLAVCFAAAPALAEKRIALVVGNSNYNGGAFGPLTNPLNDARLVEKTLTDLHFDVEMLPNATKAQLEAAIGRLGERLGAAGEDAVGVFYFAGHGYLSQGRNYMIPVDARARTEQQVWSQAPSIGLVEQYMEAAGNRVNFILIDACRTNSLPASVRGGSNDKLVDTQTEGLMYLFAAKPGFPAKDGEGAANGPFALALAKYLKTPGLIHSQVFSRITDEVRQLTGGEQTPWLEGAIMGGDFCFTDCTTPAVVEREVIKYVETKPAPVLTLTQTSSEPVPGYVFGFALAPDGGRIAGWDYKARTAILKVPGSTKEIINTKAGKMEEVRTEKYQPPVRLNGHAGEILAADFSPDGALIVTGSDDKSARIWNTKTGKMQRKLDATGAVTSVAFSQDGAQVAGRTQGGVSIWDAKSGNEIAKLQASPSYGGNSRIAFSADGQSLLVAAQPPEVIVIASGKRMKLEEKTETTTGAAPPSAAQPAFKYNPTLDGAFSLDGKWVATGSEDGSLRIWDAQSGRMVKKLEGHPDDTTRVAFSPDGKLLLSLSKDRNLTLWDIESGSAVAREYSAGQEFAEAYFSPDGQSIVATNRSSVISWRIERPATPPGDSAPNSSKP